MSSTLVKILRVLFWVLIGISAVFGIMFYTGGITPETVNAKYQEPVFTQLLINWAYFLFFAATALAVVFAIISMIANPKGAVRTLIALVIMGVIAAIAYGLASDEILVFPGSAEMDITNSLSKNVGMGIISVYLLLLIATVSIVVTEISAYFK